MSWDVFFWIWKLQESRRPHIFHKYLFNVYWPVQNNINRLTTCFHQFFSILGNMRWGTKADAQHAVVNVLATAFLSICFCPNSKNDIILSWSILIFPYLQQTSGALLCHLILQCSLWETQVSLKVRSFQNVFLICVAGAPLMHHCLSKKKAPKGHFEMNWPLNVEALDRCKLFSL